MNRRNFVSAAAEEQIREAIASAIKPLLEEIERLKKDHADTQEALESWFPVGVRLMALFGWTDSSGHTPMEALERAEQAESANRALVEAANEVFDKVATLRIIPSECCTIQWDALNNLRAALAVHEERIKKEVK